MIVAGKRIVLQSAEPAALRFSARRLQDALRTNAGVEWELVAAAPGSVDESGAALIITPGHASHPQGYALTITPDEIRIEANDATGIFYAVCTLIQIVEQSGKQLPCVKIVDWPDFAARGVMLDVSRDKVPTLETLLELVDLLASWKINQIQLYTEHTFAYRKHPEVWAEASPITGQDILTLDAYCRERFIELVPNQNSFGHMHRWLQHPRYAPLAEVTEGFTTPWGYVPGPFSLAPLEPGSLTLVRSLYDELLPHFSSRLFNVGCDETFDLGQGRSKAAREEQGVGRVYLDFLLKIYADVKARGHTMQFWGDIIVQHPELIPELPNDVIALDWGYEATHPFDRECPQFAAAGLTFYVCPGTSSWCSLAGRTDNTLGNLLNAAENGLAHGATGYLITDWGDRGHWQFLPISYLGFVAGAAYSWALDANRELDVQRTVSVHAFRDSSCSIGHVAYNLGNVYRTLSELSNSSQLFWILQLTAEQLRQRMEQHAKEHNRFNPSIFDNVVDVIDEALQPLGQSAMQRLDVNLIKDEFTATARLMRHACRRAQLFLGDNGSSASALRRELDQDMHGFIAEYRRLWLARNRPGGLADSVARFEHARAEYR
jgi:hypothetical protein